MWDLGLRLRLHGTGPEPFRTEPGRISLTSVFTGPFWNWSGTDSNGSKIGPVKKVGPVLDPSRAGSGTVPCKQKANPIRFSDRIHLDPFRTDPV